LNVTDRLAAVSVMSPAAEAVTGGTAPVVVRVTLPCADRGTERFVTPGHTTLVPLGPSDALTVSLVAALTAVECRLARPEAAAGGNAMVRLTPAGWMGLPVVAAAGRTALTVTCTWRVPEGKPHRYSRDVPDIAVSWVPEADATPAARPLATSKAMRAVVRAAARWARDAVLPEPLMRRRRSSRRAVRGDRGG
jgi:hypothetical protein